MSFVLWNTLGFTRSVGLVGRIASGKLSTAAAGAVGDGSDAAVDEQTASVAEQVAEAVVAEPPPPPAVDFASSERLGVFGPTHRERGARGLLGGAEEPVQRAERAPRPAREARPERPARKSKRSGNTRPSGPVVRVHSAPGSVAPPPLPEAVDFGQSSAELSGKLKSIFDRELVSAATGDGHVFHNTLAALEHNHTFTLSNKLACLEASALLHKHIDSTSVPTPERTAAQTHKEVATVLKNALSDVVGPSPPVARDVRP